MDDLTHGLKTMLEAQSSYVIFKHCAAIDVYSLITRVVNPYYFDVCNKDLRGFKNLAGLATFYFKRL